jgi:hypothetical protein
VQQLSLTSGVATGAAVIELSRVAHADSVLRAQDFGAAFVVVAAISAVSALVFARLPRNAGASLTRAQAEAASSPADAPEAAPLNPVART